MGQHVAATPGIQHVVEGRRTSCCRRQQPYEGGNFRLSRPTVSRTPRNRQHNSVTEAELLVAKSEEGRRRIRQRVRDVSSKQNQHAPPETSPISHHDRPRRATLRSRHYGLHHEPLPSPRDKAKHFVSIPPADGRTIGTKQSMGGTVPPTLEQRAAR